MLSCKCNKLFIAIASSVSLLGVWRRVCSESGAKQWPEKEFLNPLKDPLPDAPNMRIYCMYGVGAPAERSYHYQHVEDPMVQSGRLSVCTCYINTTSHCLSELKHRVPKQLLQLKLECLS